MSFDWWVGKHNRHHTNPNHEDLDPDISITALAFTPDQASSRHGLVRLMARYQAWLFFPLLLLEAAHLHLASIKAILLGRGRANTIEGLLLVAHVAGYLAALVWVLSPLQAVAFVVVQQGLFGLYLGCSFAPNHKGMPTLTDADQLGLPAPSGADLAQRAGELAGRPCVGGAELPDRAPPVPDHAPAQPAPGPAPGPGVLPAPRPALYRGQPVRLLRPGGPPPPSVGAPLRPAVAE